VTSAHSDAILERLMSLHPKIIDLTLDRMTRLLDALGNPEHKLPPVIHIAGTNGKGSTAAMIRAGIEGSGGTAHVYTSPHLARFHERIRVAGELISEADLAEVLDTCEQVNGGANITYFEITTCAALLAFSRTPADYTILEVGLGGRLDATNVVPDPALTVITPVSVDHQQYLGNTLAEIAREKAGVLKRDVLGIVAPQDPLALEVIEREAARIGARLRVHGQHWLVWEERGRLVYQDDYGLIDLPMPVLIGAHQVVNAGTAIAALRSLGMRKPNYEAAMTRAEWPARLQRLRKGPLADAAQNAELWLDGGHNAAAGIALAEALGRLPAKPLHLITGMLNTKDIAGYLRPLAAVARDLHGVSIPGESATLPAQETVAAARAVGMAAEVAPDVLSAVRDIAAKDPGARILICGSLYLAGNVLRDNG
jgi:dihydrofolate synthase/folylpolyglutamate synthase